MTLENCPTSETLESLLLGKLPAPERERWGQHLLSCESCVAIADTLSAQDELTVAIRARRTLQGDEALVAQAIERGRQLHSQIETVESDVTVIFGLSERAGGQDAANAGRSSGEEIDFLAPPEQPDEIGRLGGYRVLEVLGVGGMGVVFRAEDPRLKRQVALKAMKPAIAASRSAKDRFLREAQAAAALDHDHIVHIYQVGEDRHLPFIAMQHLRGESLQTRLDREGRLEPAEVLRIGRETATGLAAAHRQKLVHRDIKPDNIWIESANGRVKILDFGLVRTATDDAGLTVSGMVLGTPRYMAPEQALAQHVDARCDLFSLGAVLYHLASGKPPFTGRDPQDTLRAVVESHPAAVDSLCPELPPELARLITRLLSKDRDERPQSAEEVAREIEAIEESLTSAATRQESIPHPPTRSPAAAAPRPRSRRPVLMAGTIVALLLAAGFGLWAAGIIFKVETQDGALVVKVEGDDFTTSVQSRTVTIENAATHEKFTVKLDSPETMQPNLKPGEYKFVLESNSGLKTKTNRFTINSGKNTQVEVWWEPKEPSVARNDGQSKQADKTFEPLNTPPRAISPFDADQALAYQEAWARHLHVPVEYTNSLGMKFRLIPPGEFLMGSTPDEIDAAFSSAGENEFWRACIKSEGPQHKVVLTKPIYLGIYEVTQAEYKRVMGSNPSWCVANGGGRDLVTGLDTSRHPVEIVPWNDAVEFCARLSESESFRPAYKREGGSAAMNLTGGYRLPTEAEWEFACRAGTTTKYWTGDPLDRLADAAWHGRPEGRTHAVGQLKANPFGLYDTHGNVYEWVYDVWTPTYYDQFRRQPALDPTGPPVLKGLRILRGGDWYYTAPECRSSARYGCDSRLRPPYAIGFRVAIPVETVQQGPSPKAEPDRRAAAFVEAHGITPAALKIWAASLPSGYCPSWVAPRVGAAETLFDAVATPDPNGWEWQLQVMTGDTAPKYAEMSKTHRLLINVTYQHSPNASVRLWVKDGEAWSYWYSDAQFIDEKLAEARIEGVPPSSLTVEALGESPLYEVTFGDHAGLTCEWSLSLSPEELAVKVEEYRARGWRPHIVNTHLQREPLRFLAVFVENPAEIKWEFSPSLTIPEYEGQLAARKAQGYLPQCVCSWVETGIVRYTVVWTREANVLQ